MADNDKEINSPEPMIGPPRSVTEFGDDDFTALLQVGSYLEKFHRVIPCGDTELFPAPYLAAVARFAAAAFAAAGKQDSPQVHKHWLEGELPIHYNPLIEIGPDALFPILLRALTLCRGPESAALQISVKRIGEELSNPDHPCTRLRRA